MRRPRRTSRTALLITTPRHQVSASDCWLKFARPSDSWKLSAWRARTLRRSSREGSGSLSSQSSLRDRKQRSCHSRRCSSTARLRRLGGGREDSLVGRLTPRSRRRGPSLDRRFRAASGRTDTRHNEVCRGLPELRDDGRARKIGIVARTILSRHDAGLSLC